MYRKEGLLISDRDIASDVQQTRNISSVLDDRKM